MDYALWVQGGNSAVGGATRSDALVNFNGMVLIVDAVGDDAARQWLREGAFFQQPEDLLALALDQHQHSDHLGGHSVEGGAAMMGAPEQLPLVHSGDDLVRQALKLFVQAMEQCSAQEHGMATLRVLEELRLGERAAREVYSDPKEYADTDPDPGGLHDGPPAL